MAEFAGISPKHKEESFQKKWNIYCKDQIQGKKETQNFIQLIC